MLACGQRHQWRQHRCKPQRHGPAIDLLARDHCATVSHVQYGGTFGQQLLRRRAHLLRRAARWDLHGHRQRAEELQRVLSMDTLVLLAVLAAIIFGLVSWAKSAARKRRREALYAKYGDAEVVDKIMARMMWQGQSMEQLTDSLGNPADTDSRVMKTKHREVWKYHPAGKNRYRLRVTVENGVVVGWDQK